jgi:arylsulfatase A-like enzyme
LKARRFPEFNFNMKLKHLFILSAALLEFYGIGRGQIPTAVPSNSMKTLTPAIPRRTSIVFVQCDRLGAGDLSCYGQAHFQTPNIDRLAAGGIRFTNYSAGAASGSLAFASLMLGKDSRHLQQREDATVPLGPEELTIAQILKNSGYRTGLIGEWNLGDENSSGAPWKKGFDEFAGFFDAKDAANFYADYLWRFTPYSSYNKTNGQWDGWNPAKGLPEPGREMIYVNTRGKNLFIPDLLTKAALGFLSVNQPDPFNRYRPFFLMVNYRIPGDGSSPVPTDAPFSDENWPQPARNEAAMMVRLDGYVGQLLEQLQKLGMTNDTAIFFTAATPPQRTGAAATNFFNAMVASNDLRVPMIVYWPGHAPAGAVSDFAWSAKDFMPTAAAMASAKGASDNVGNAVLTILLGRVAK